MDASAAVAVAHTEATDAGFGHAIVPLSPLHKKGFVLANVGGPLAEGQGRDWIVHHGPAIGRSASD
jgi:hypothetical protein